MARKNKAATAQIPLVGFPTPPTETVDQPKQKTERDQPQQTVDAPREHGQQTVKTSQRPKQPATKSKANEFHHHVIQDDEIVRCYDTLSEALHEQKEIKKQGVDALLIESYAGTGPCRRKASMQ